MVVVGVHRRVNSARRFQILGFVDGTRIAHDTVTAFEQRPGDAQTDAVRCARNDGRFYIHDFSSTSPRVRSETAQKFHAATYVPRSDLKPARTSSEKSFGCSQAA